MLIAQETVRDLVAEDPLLLDNAGRLCCPGGQLIFDPSQPREVLYFLRRGQVEVYHRSPHGQKVVTAVLGPGAMFGEMPIVGQSMQFAFAEAVEEAELATIDRETIEGLLLTKPQVALSLLSLLGRRLQDVEVLLSELAFTSVPARVASLLFRRYREEGRVIPCTQEEVAREVGAPRPATQQALTVLEECGIIRLGRRRVYVIDPQGLQAIA